MTEGAGYGLFMLVLGGVVLLAVPIRSALRKATLPALIGFIGLCLSAADRSLGGVTRALHDQIEMLAQLGLVALLFRVGLESDLDRLIGQLRRAVAACIFGPGVVSRLLGYEARRGEGAK
jgi:Kef-type K+ transport system membrane component KefB